MDTLTLPGGCSTHGVRVLRGDGGHRHCKAGSVSPVASSTRGHPASFCPGSGDLQSSSGSGMSSHPAAGRDLPSLGDPKSPQPGQRTRGASAGLGPGVTPALLRRAAVPRAWHPSRQPSGRWFMQGQALCHAWEVDLEMPPVLTRPVMPSPSTPVAALGGSPAACPSPRCRGRAGSSHPAAAAAAPLSARLCRLRSCRSGTESCHLWVVENDYPLLEWSRRESGNCISLHSPC